MTHLLMVILDDLSCLPDLLQAWREIGVRTTIMESVGARRAETWLSKAGLANLDRLFDAREVHRRTLLAVIEEDKLAQNSFEVGQHLREGLEDLQKKYPSIGDVRGLGLMQACEFVKEGKEPDGILVGKLFEEMKKFEEVMGKMAFKKPPKETWELYWSGVYNRLERGIGWIFMSIGAMILLFFGGYKMVEGIVQDPEIPLLLKVGILAVLAGMVVLLVSFGRERIFVDKRERYKEVQK